MKSRRDIAISEAREGRARVNRSQQIKELLSRVPPVVNVDIVVVKNDKYLIGRRPKTYAGGPGIFWIFPGGRMHYTETPQETAYRILKRETGIKAKLKKLITVASVKGYDFRAHGITIFYLFEYTSGIPKANEQLDKFRYVTPEELTNFEEAFHVDREIVREINAAVRTQNTTEDEILIEVDENNKVIGSIIKREAHMTNKRYHRAAHIVVFNSKGQVVLQQRSFRKAHLPGVWDFAGGHEVVGQTIEQTASAELAEEMGIGPELHFVRTGLAKKAHQAEFYNLYYAISDGPYGFDRSEVERLKTFDCQKLIDGHYSEEYKIHDKAIDYINELRNVWKPLSEKPDPGSS